MFYLEYKEKEKRKSSYPYKMWHFMVDMKCCYLLYLIKAMVSV